MKEEKGIKRGCGQVISFILLCYIFMHVPVLEAEVPAAKENATAQAARYLYRIHMASPNRSQIRYVLVDAKMKKEDFESSLVQICDEGRSKGSNHFLVMVYDDAKVLDNWDGSGGIEKIHSKSLLQSVRADYVGDRWEFKMMQASDWDSGALKPLFWDKPKG